VWLWRCPAARRKRLTDAEAKLRVALQEKATAAQEKGALERQLKQFQGHKMLMEKSLEKKDAIENKKRESIMVVSARRHRPSLCCPLRHAQERQRGVGADVCAVRARPAEPEQEQGAAEQL
jgi:hypothetical protein